MSGTPPASRPIPALDGVRGLAILAVILFHGLSTNGAVPATRLERAYYGILNMGSAGVDVFFVLSGFLITRILLRAKDRPHYFRTFYIRRSLRIFPAYYAYLILAFTLVLSAGIGASRGDYFVAYFMYVQNWFPLWGTEPLPGIEMGSLGHLWSLAVEEQFYLFWPGLIFLFSRKGMCWLCLAIVLGTPLLRWLALSSGVTHYTIYVNTLWRVDNLALGSLLALAPSFAMVSRRHFAAFVGFVVAYSVCVRIGARFGDIETIMSVGFHAGVGLFAVLLVVASISDTPVPFVTRALENPVLAWCGRYSYGLYLFHWPIMAALMAPFSESAGLASKPILSHLVYVALCGALSVLAAGLSWVLIERRFVRMKDELAGAPLAIARREA